MTALIDDAIRIALDVHKGQVDKAKVPYILHPLRVMNLVDVSKLDRRNAEILQAVAVLHDAVEDADYPGDVAMDIFNLSPIVHRMVTVLTRPEDEPYEEYIAKVAAHQITRKVKIADLIDNMDPERNQAIGRARPPQKYVDAYSFLTTYPIVPSVL